MRTTIDVGRDNVDSLHESAVQIGAVPTTRLISTDARGIDFSIITDQWNTTSDGRVQSIHAFP